MSTRPPYNGGDARIHSTAYLNAREFLAMCRLPGRLCAWQAAVLLGFEEHHIPILVAARLLKALGSPPKHAPKFFGRDYVLGLAADQRWLSKASDTLVAHWAVRNIGKQSNHEN